MAEQEFTTEELANEIWVSIPNHENAYEVSNLGRVRSLNRVKVARMRPITHYLKGRVLKPVSSRGSYAFVALPNGNGGGKRCTVHRLVLRAFMGEPISGNMQGNHKDGCKQNNRLSNLEWVTPKENARHARRTGLMPSIPYQVGSPGQKNAASKLTDDIVREIRIRYAEGVISTRALARKYSVRRGTIAFILHRKTWKHVADHLDLDAIAGRNRDKAEKRIHPRGEQGPKAKLTEHQVRAIFNDTRRQAALAREYGVSKGAIAGIRHGRNWKHLHLKD